MNLRKHRANWLDPARNKVVLALLKLGTEPRGRHPSPLCAIIHTSIIPQTGLATPQPTAILPQ